MKSYYINSILFNPTKVYLLELFIFIKHFKNKDVCIIVVHKSNFHASNIVIICYYVVCTN